MNIDSLCRTLGGIGIAALISAPVSAEPEPLMGLGFGAESCGTYVENRRVPDKLYDSQIFTWLSGYVSAYNRYSGKSQVKRALNYDSVLVYLDKYCREHPISSISIGIDELIDIYSRN